jgi:hypothetical protein
LTVANPVNFSIFQGDAATTVFGFTFAIPVGDTGSDIYVYYIAADGTITLLTSNLTLDLNAKTVTYPVTPGISPLSPSESAVPVGAQLAVFRIESLVQALNLTTQGPYPAAGIMAALDYLTMIAQQLQEQINRCVKYPIGQVPTSTDVNAFIAAVSAAIAQPPIQGTYSYCKSVAEQNPTIYRFAIVTDQNDQGTNQLFFYSGNVAAGDGGWFGPLTGGA